MSGLATGGYYAILDLGEEAAMPDRAELARRASELLAAGPCALQLRAKRLAAAALRDAARELLPLCRAAQVPLCVNDRLDVALAVGADLCHLGQDDLPLADARRLAAGRGIGLGVSTHDVEQASAAAAAGADYIGFGPIFETRTKANPDPVVGLAALARVTATVGVPVVAIGGITLDRVSLVAAAGARAAAVISAIDAAPDRTAAGRQVAASFVNHETDSTLPGFSEVT